MIPAPLPQNEAGRRAALASYDTTDSIRAFAQERGIALVVDAAPCALLADAAGIIQVLVNLLSNAIKFSPAGSLVEADVRRIAQRSVSSTSACAGRPDQTVRTP